jgi:hypothetical protein
LRIRQGLGVLDGTPVNNFSNRQLADFSADRARDVLYLNDLLRHVERRRIVAQLCSDAVAQVLVQNQAGAKPHEQHYAHIPGRAAIDLLSHRNALENLRHLIDLPVDLGGPNADASRVERGIAPPVNDVATVASDLRPIAMPPHVREILEVRGAIFLTIGIVPERHRHARKRPRANELAGNQSHRASTVVEHIDSHAESWRLNLSAIDGHDRIAEHRNRR